MTIFAGIKGYRACKRYQMPMSLYRKWLAEKWKADLKVVAWGVVMSPLLAFWCVGAMTAVVGGAIGICIAGVGQLMVSTKNVLPRCIFLPENLRAKQLAIADESRRQAVWRPVANPIDKDDCDEHTGGYDCQCYGCKIMRDIANEKN